LQLRAILSACGGSHRALSLRTDADLVADKLTPLVLDALARAAADPSGLPLHASKADPGLFPASAAAKPAAQKCLQEGLIHVVRTDLKGKQSRDLYAATDKGLQFLIDHGSPKQVLDDFVRVLEERQAEVSDLLAAAKRMAAGLEGMKRVAEAVLPRVEMTSLPSPQPPVRRDQRERAGLPAPAGRGEDRTALLEPVTTTELAELVLTRLHDWAATAGVPRDCPLPELFASLSTLDPAPTVGQFHDALRRLHDDRRVYLHPWTGPLYALPDPAAALLVGHEVAFYASLR
jgi:hypothetical protein